MFSYNLTGTQRGQHVLCTRSMDETTQPVSIVHRYRNIVDFCSNGDNLSYTQMMDIVNEKDDADPRACTTIDNTVWSPTGPLMRTQDRRLQFLRFTQRDSIMFAAVGDDSRHLVEIQLASNKFVLQTSFELTTCHPISADACNKYIWAVTAENNIEVYNMADKEHRTLAVPEEFLAKSILITCSDGRSAVVVFKHIKKHYAYIGHLSLTDSDLVLNDVSQIGKTGTHMQPGTLVQRKAAIMFTVANSDQQQLVTMAAHKDTLFCSIHNISMKGMINNEPVQRLLFTDIVVSGDDCIVAVLMNRNSYTMWSFDMNSAKVKYVKMQVFPDTMSDLIIDRVILMRQRQDKLEEQPSLALISSVVTDSITMRMRQQVEISTSTARAMAEASRGATETTRQAVNLKELCMLRDAHETMKKQMIFDNQKSVKELTSKHNVKVLELEQRITDLIAARDARIAVKQHDALKDQLEKIKLELRSAHQLVHTAQASLVELRTTTDLSISELEQRNKVLTAERNSLREVQSVHDSAVKKLHDEYKFAAGVLRDQLSAQKDHNSRILVKQESMQSKYDQLEKSTASEILLLGAQLNEALAKARDVDLLQQVAQLKLQNETMQQRGRIQFDTLHREIDSLRKANTVLSQSYNTLKSITDFKFLPNGTSIETALEMIRHLSVFQQDVAIAREEAAELRKKVKDLESA